MDSLETASGLPPPCLRARAFSPALMRVPRGLRSHDLTPSELIGSGWGFLAAAGPIRFSRPNVRIRELLMLC